MAKTKNIKNEPPNATFDVEMAGPAPEAEPNVFDELYSESTVNKPLKDVKDKWKLVPAFLRLRGLVKQHIDSFNHFIEVDMKEMVAANSLVTSDHPNFRDYYVKFTNIYVEKPTIKEDFGDHNLSPNECRIRDLTYSGPIYVDLKYTRGDKIHITKKVHIGNMPIMLGSTKCWLTGKDFDSLAKIRECPYDPKGYFIIKGSEKVVLIQEQISKNRIIIEEDPKKNLCAQVTSSSLTQKTRTTIIYKNSKFYLQQNSFADPIPIAVIFKAMGMQCD